MDYAAPVQRILFTLEHVAGLAQVLELDPEAGFSSDMVEGVLGEAGRFATEVLAPLNRPGDVQGARFLDGAVVCPDGWPQAYRAWAAGGWNGVALPVAWGGMGGPALLNAATMEIWTGACMAFGLGPVLAQGAVEALLAHAADPLKETYVAKLVSGEWTATMALTEPQAGSDLGELRTQARPQADGSYRISGQKIFITYGDHDLAENIVHLVLARLPDAPKGPRGISLFVVPKRLVQPDGALGELNDVRCVGIEHKLGIHGAPTCVMAYGDTVGALGWLVGEENRGLAAMFTMMNRARLATGLQGVAIAERAYQQALAFAETRRQGRRPGSTAQVPIIEHPDVRRMLKTMSALTSAARCIAYAAAQAIDRADLATDSVDRAYWSARAALLTPITKAYAGDMGFEVASLGVQIHGGMGYVEETGAAQYLRDARIVSIYEGANGIQAIDLLSRKVAPDEGAIAAALLSELRDSVETAGAIDGPAFQDIARGGREALKAAFAATRWLVDPARTEDERLGAASTYLRLLATALAAGYLAKGALAARSGGGPAQTDFIDDARFYATHVATAAPGLLTTIREGGPALLDTSSR